MKGASLTGGGFGQAKLRGERDSEKERSATGGPRRKELSNGQQARWTG